MIVFDAVPFLPRPSVTVAVMVSAPAEFITSVVNDAVVYAFPPITVLYDAIGEPCDVVAFISTLNLDKPFKDVPKPLVSAPTSVTVSEQEGFTDAGIAHDMVLLVVPISVPPLVYVHKTNFVETVVPVVFSVASEIGGVNETLELLVFTAIVPIS